MIWVARMSPSHYHEYCYVSEFFSYVCSVLFNVCWWCNILLGMYGLSVSCILHMMSYWAMLVNQYFYTLSSIIFMLIAISGLQTPVIRNCINMIDLHVSQQFATSLIYYISMGNPLQHEKWKARFIEIFLWLCFGWRACTNP